MNISDRFILGETKKRSVDAKKNYIRIVPDGSQTAFANETIEFKFPHKSPGKYMDATQSFISFTFTSSSNTVRSSVSGVSGFFKSSTLRCGGSELSSLTNYQLLMNLTTKQSTPDDYINFDGNIMNGMGDTLLGTGYTGNVAKDHLLFLSDLAPLFKVNKFLTLDTTNPLILNLLIGGVADNFTYTNDGNGNTHVAVGPRGLIFSNIILHLCVVSVPDDVEQYIIQRHSGLFKEIVNNIIYVQKFAEVGSAQFSFALPISMSSLNRIDVCMTENTSIATIPYNNFMRRNLTSSRLLVNGVPIAVPHGINNGNLAIACAMNRVAQQQLTDTGKYSLSNSNNFFTNTFYISFDLETIKDSELYSGLNVANSTIVLELSFSAAIASPGLNVHAFCHHNVEISCDKNGSNDWELAI